MEKTNTIDKTHKNYPLLKYGLTSSRFQYSEISDRAYEVSYKAKKRHRSDIRPKEWNKGKYSETSLCSQTIQTPFPSTKQIAIEYYNELTTEDFEIKYEKPNLPVLIKEATSNWPAVKNWKMKVNICII